jgi:hypothetical protein
VIGNGAVVGVGNEVSVGDGKDDFVLVVAETGVEGACAGVTFVGGVYVELFVGIGVNSVHPERTIINNIDKIKPVIKPTIFTTPLHYVFLGCYSLSCRHCG